MTQRCRTTISQLMMVGAIAIILISSAVLRADRKGSFTEEFHKVYPLSAQGRVEIENINGPVHITGWDRNEVKVDAVKSAWTKERLDETKIVINAGQDNISIRTEYPSHDHTFNFGGGGEHNNPGSVEYTITVPRQARLDEIKLINGRLDIQEVSGEVRASCINGRLQVRNLKGPADLKTINGELEAAVDQLPSTELKLSSVNGRLQVTLPSDVKAEIDARTVSGSISNDFGLPASGHQFVGHSLHGQLGGGGTRVKLSNVNGSIEIRHASDNRPLSPAKNLEREHKHDAEDKDDEI